MSEIFRVSVGGGKYAVVADRSRGLRARRHGEEWRDCAGDKLIYALAAELDEARSAHAAAIAKARANALEEAAAEVMRVGFIPDAEEISAAIRALKDRAP